MVPMRARLFVLLAVILWAPSCSAQMVGLLAPPTPQPTSVTYSYLAGVEGFTVCYKGKGLSYLNLTSGMSALEEADVRAHEAKHREQYTRAGCEAFFATYQTPKGMLEAEAEAFHAGACVAIAGGMDAQELEALYVQRIYTYYVNGTPLYEILQAYRRYPCS